MKLLEWFFVINVDRWISSLFAKMSFNLSDQTFTTMFRFLQHEHSSVKTVDWLMDHCQVVINVVIVNILLLLLLLLL